MPSKSGLVAFTTIQYGVKPNIGQRIRSAVSLDTASNLRTLGIPCLALTGPCSKGYMKEVHGRGIVTVPQKGGDMGEVRREALRAAIAAFPSATHYLWLEPEKPDLPQHALRLWNLMRSENAALGLFNRINMESYPREQAHYYLFCRAVASALLGFEVDYAFGPMIMTKKSIPYFLEYAGEYGDRWDSILVPRLRVMHAQLKISILESDFRNDTRMTRAERGNLQFILKRIKQFDNVARSLVSEWQKLNR